MERDRAIENMSGLMLRKPSRFHHIEFRSNSFLLWQSMSLAVLFFLSLSLFSVSSFCVKEHKVCLCMAQWLTERFEFLTFLVQFEFNLWKSVQVSLIAIIKLHKIHSSLIDMGKVGRMSLRFGLVHFGFEIFLFTFSLFDEPSLENIFYFPAV